MYVNYIVHYTYHEKRLILVLPIQNKRIIKIKNCKKYERFIRFRIKSRRSISLPFKNMSPGAPRDHITTGIFSTDKVVSLSVKFVPKT